MGCFSCKTPARPRPAASRRLGSAPSTGHVLLAWRKREIRLQNTPTASLFFFRFFFSLYHLFSIPLPHTTPVPFLSFSSLFATFMLCVFVERILLSIWLCFHQRAGERGVSELHDHWAVNSFTYKDSQSWKYRVSIGLKKTHFNFFLR